MNELVPQGDGAGNELSVLLDEAERRIKFSDLGGESSFQTLPVVFLIGLSGSGRTTAMTQSGLDPELLAGRVAQEGAILPTDLANIWFAGGTIFVEPGLKLQMDQDLWLRLLERFRSNNAAPRAALVCQGCDYLVAPNAPALAIDVAQRIRSRLNEISKTLSVQLPVYVLFTKLDRVLFFLEFARDLLEQETSMVLGTTLAVTDEQPLRHDEREGSRLKQSFEELVFSLAGKRPEFLAREKEGAALGAVYEFPREFRKVQVPVVQFLLELGRPGQLRPNPFLRGFYFCGVRPITRWTQSNTASSRVAASEAVDPQKTRRIRVESVIEGGQTREFRFETATPSAARPGTQGSNLSARRFPQWVLLKDFFSSVLLADNPSLRACSPRGKTSSRAPLLMAASAAVIILLAVLFTISFVKNQALLNKFIDTAKAIPAKNETGSVAIEPLEQLDSMRLQLVQLRQFERDGPPWTMGWGLYAGSKAYPEFRRLYFDRFKSLLFNETQQSLVRELKALPDSPGPTDDYSRAYNTLRAWLETTSHHESAAANFLPAVLEDRWVHDRNIDPRIRKLARNQFEFYTSELSRANPLASDENRELVAKARKYLAGFGDSMRVYKSMVTEVNNVNQPLIFNRRVPGSADIVVNSYEVPGAFTKTGFGAMQKEMKNAGTFGMGADWVLGKKAATAAGDSVEAKILAFYYAEYSDHWREYLGKSAVVKFANLNQAAVKLEVLSGSQSPLFELLSIAAQNTSIDAAEVKKSFAPLEGLTPNAVESYKTALANLRTAIGDSAKLPADQNSESAAKIRDAGNAALAITRKIEEGLGRDPDAHIETLIAKLLEQPIINVTILAPAGASADRQNGAGTDLRFFRSQP